MLWLFIKLMLVTFGIVSASTTPLTGHDSAINHHVRARNATESNNIKVKRGVIKSGSGVATAYYNRSGVKECQVKLNAVMENEGELWQSPKCALNYNGDGKPLGFWNTGDVVAIATHIVDHDYSICGKKITVHGRLKSKELVVFDGCGSCGDGDLDLSWDVYTELFGTPEQQSVSNNCGPEAVTWEISDEIMPGYEVREDNTHPNLNPTAWAFHDPLPPNGWLGHGCVVNKAWCEGTSTRWACGVDAKATSGPCPAGTTCDLALPYRGYCL